MRRKGAPEESIDTMLNSISTATLKQYEACLRRWWIFALTNNINPFEASVKEVLLFLQNLLVIQKNGKYSFFNTHRSALSLIFPGSLGDDPLIKRFMKGVARQNPSGPKYNVTWDPHSILSYLQTMDIHDTQNLTKILVTLLLIATGQRLQTISLIKLSNINNLSTGLRIFIPDCIKTSGINRVQPVLDIPFFHEVPELCLANNILEYLRRTEDIRQGEDLLFLTLKIPHKAASKQTLSRWVKDTLQSAGLDVGIFKPHSTRHASTSAASRLGIPIDKIQQAAGWTEKSKTFAKFYNRPLLNSESYVPSLLRLGV